MSTSEILERDHQRKVQKQREREQRRDTELVAAATRVHNGPTPHQILRLRDVIRVTARSRSAILRAVDAGSFPRPIPLGGRSCGWLASEIAAWQEDRIRERDAARRKQTNKIET
jgi:prophage regulatory protein